MHKISTCVTCIVYPILCSHTISNKTVNQILLYVYNNYKHCIMTFTCSKKGCMHNISTFMTCIGYHILVCNAYHSNRTVNQTLFR